MTLLDSNVSVKSPVLSPALMLTVAVVGSTCCCCWVSTVLVTAVVVLSSSSAVRKSGESGLSISSLLVVGKATSCSFSAGQKDNQY